MWVLFVFIYLFLFVVLLTFEALNLNLSLLYSKPFICIVKELNIDLRHIDHLQSDHLHKYATFVSLFHAGLLNFLYEVIYRWDVQRLSSYGLSILRLYFKSMIINMGKNGTHCILKYWKAPQKKSVLDKLPLRK